MKKTARGMTLIELIIVVAILGIIAAIGYPSYLGHVKKTRRAEGMGELLELADRMERHYSDIGSYDQNNGSDMTADVIYHTTTAGGYYTLSIAAGTDNVQFTASATPTSKGQQNTDKCGTFTINSLGTKSVSGGSLTTDDCNWK